jgi:murein DD-endopeptidase MepM/ murein hydrolase activator NlpD
MARSPIRHGLGAHRGAVWLAVLILLLAGCASPGHSPSSGVRPPPAVAVADGAGGAVPLRLGTVVEDGRLVSGFGWRGPSLGGGGIHHDGIDIAARRGTPVRAVAVGTIAEIGRDRGYGRFVRIRHSQRLETFYAHLSQADRSIAVGRRVTPETVIGYVGSTGRSSGPHLHFEVRRAGKPIDPLASSMARAQ